MLALEIALDQITIPAGRRAVDGAAVERLKESIAVVGLQHPITVRELDGAYVLVAGAHRFAAFGKLNMQKIPANVVDLNVLEAELFEIDENFARKELSEGERSLSHARREEIYRALNGKSGRRYDEVAAEATGQSARSVRRDVARGKALGQDMLAKVVGTSLDKGTELDALTKLPVAERESLVARAAAGELFGDRQAAGKASGARCDVGSPVAAGEAGEPAQSATPDPHDDDALWRAFLAQGDRAIAMASYSEGPLDEEIVEKVRAVIGAWQRLLVLLTAELSKDSESWE
jgi:ParB family transcriptional regulator, chromosome partitioning protein